MMTDMRVTYPIHSDVNMKKNQIIMIDHIIMCTSMSA